MDASHLEFPLPSQASHVPSALSASGHAIHPVSSSLSTPSPSPSTMTSPPHLASQTGRSQLNAASNALTGFPGQSSSSPWEELSIDELKQRAKNGDAKAQTEIGRYYLRLAEQEDEEVNCVTAVTWLLQAAKHGRKDAVKLLQRCLHDRRGITSENREEVRSLACESRFERSVRKAALLMYWKLNPERKKTISASEILENMSQLNTETDGAPSSSLSSPARKQRKVLESLVSRDGTDNVDLEEFVENTKLFAQGISPTPAMEGVGTDDDDDDDEEPVKNPDELPLNQKVLKFPLHAVMEVKEVLIDWASRAGMQWISALIPTHHVNTLIFFFIISNLTLEFFVLVIPLIIFYLSFMSMVICTLRVFQNSKAWENFRALTAMLAHFEPGIDLVQAECNFTWNHLEPYLYFLLSTLFLIISFPLADKSWLPCSELATIAFFLTVSSYLSLRPTARQHAKLALLMQVASAICELSNHLLGGWKGRIVGGSWFSIHLSDLFVLHVGVPCISYFYLLYLCARMATAGGARGTYSVLLPYLVCFIWCELSVTLLQESTALGLMRTTVGYLLFFFALPVLSLALAVVMLVQLVQWFLALELAKMALTVCVCVLPVLLRWWTRFSMSPLAVLRSLRRSSVVKLILVWISALVLFSWFYVYRSEGMKVYNSTLTWHQYSDICGPRAWKERNMAHTQIICSHLQGHRVTWEGRFKYVRVTEIENGAQAVINLLPVFIADWVRCLYGEEYPACDASQPGPAEPLCQLKTLTKHKCHVKRFDHYKFEVTMGMPQEKKGRNGGHDIDDATKDIVLRASNEFRGVLLALSSGSVVEFSTVLEGRLGSKWPVFELKALHCKTCASPLVPIQRQVKIEQDWRVNARNALAFAFNFLFHPLISVEVDVNVGTTEVSV
ncbi:wolframin-like [Xyrauchen texanus]|uniref:wolframin-like n=1 Tax=Xyrauchen texanus TaxID=154827 RepID=UPI002241C074|nr:wolframin-like [Xyrauchen texanus]XP_052010621.1 wolframin-like [Xyrauchen texanus]XP_052010622.1 wolframin-like [Xyrauchen texanus]